MIPATEPSTSSRPNAFDRPNASGAARPAGSEGQLSDSEQRKLDELKQTDARVKRHEEAHKAAAGPLFRGGPNYTYETGPDGKRYAVAGSVQIDSSPGRTPEETVQKAQAIRRAARAPADPSSTDRSVAAKASRMEAAARQAIAEKSLKSTSERPKAETVPVGEAGQATERIDPDSGSDRGSVISVLSPGDLGAEVWSIVSDLANSEMLRQDRRADELTAAAPSLDLLA